MSVDLKRVLISDAVDPLCVKLLEQHGIKVTCKFKLPKDELIKELQSHDGLIVRSDTKVTADVINATSSLKAIGRAGTGVDNIDLDAATKKGIIVLNTPGGNSISACELTCILIASLSRNVPSACQSLKEGRWDRKLYMGSELSGKTLAVLGLGRIGREVATRMQSFGMRTVGFDPIVTHEAAKEFNVEKMELEQIWPIADYITVHTPLIPQTRNLINDNVFTKCKKGVRVVNVARGGIIDESALQIALNDGRCGGAALDVFTEEPPKSSALHELIKHPKVIVTPHLGANTNEAQQRVAIEIAEQFVALASNCTPEDRAKYSVTGVVNALVLSAAMIPDNVPWITLGTQLGRLSARLAGGISNIQITVQTSGEGMDSKRFLQTAVLVGVLSEHYKSGLNLINAPALANESGIQISVKHQPGHQRSVSVAVSNKHTIAGTVEGNQLPHMLSIDDSLFDLGGVPLDDKVRLFQGQDSATLFKFITDLSSKVTITNVSLPSTKQTWLAARILQDIPISSIPGVNVF